MKVEKRNLLTIQDLLKFCQENEMYKFSSKEHGYKLSVQVPSTFEMEEIVDDAHRGMLKLKFRIFHTGLNRNGSFVSEEAAKDAMPTIKNRPILAAIHQLDNGEWDFESHNFEILYNEETEEEEIVYIEKQVGSFDESEPFFEYDEKLDKTYVCSYGYIAEDYTKAADILRAKNGTKNSVELSIDELSFNAKDNYLSLDKFYISGSTLLGRTDDGEEIGEGMLGSRADIVEFSEFNNTNQYEINQELLDEIKKLNENLSHLNINQAEFSASENLKKGGTETVNLFDELLEKYGKTVDDITFEYENLSDEELEAKFAEVFEGDADGEGEADPEPTSDGDDGEDNSVDNGEGSDDGEAGNGAEGEEQEVVVEPESESETEPEVEPVVVVESIKPEKYSITMSNGTIKEFALTLDEINYALYALVNDTYGEADDAWYNVQVYEDGTLVMYDWWNDKAFRQSYKREEDNFSLVGDRVAVKQIWVTEEEENSLKEMKSNYASLVQFKEDTENAQLHAERERILYDQKYSVLAEKDENDAYKNEAYAKLVSEMDNYSLTDLEKELKSVFADYITNGGQFAYTGEGTKSDTSKKLFAKPTGKEKPSRYGNLFKK